MRIYVYIDNSSERTTDLTPWHRIQWWSIPRATVVCSRLASVLTSIDSTFITPFSIAVGSGLSFVWKNYSELSTASLIRS